MGQPVAWKNSSSTHGGAPISGSTVTFVGSSPNYILRQTDPFTCPIHGATTVATASATRSDLDGKKIARDGDTLACGATLINGSPTRIIN